MSKKSGAIFSKSLFGYKKRDVNEYIRAADEKNSEKIKECEARINELETTLSDERSTAKAEISRLIEANKAAEKKIEILKCDYETKLAESEARGGSYLKLADDANLKVDTAENKIAELSAVLAAKESTISDLNDRIEASEKYIAELNSSIARYAMREEAERKEQNKYIKLRRPTFFRFIKK